MADQHNDRGNGITPTAEISFGMVNGTISPINVQFRDGVFAVPARIVAIMGGPEEIAKLSDALRAVSFTDFLNGYRSVLERRKINEFQAQFVADHFGRHRF